MNGRNPKVLNGFPTAAVISSSIGRISTARVAGWAEPMTVCAQLTGSSNATKATAAQRTGLFLGLVGGCVCGQSCDEGLLRNFDPPDGLHPLLAFLLLLQQFALAGDVAAVALRQHLLGECP